MVRRPEVPQSSKPTKDSSAAGGVEQYVTASINPDDLLSCGLSSGASLIGEPEARSNARSAHRKIMSYRPPTGNSIARTVKATKRTKLISAKPLYSTKDGMSVFLREPKD